MSSPPAHEPQPLDGECDRRFARVRAAFADNLSQADEIGAAVSIHVAGRKVVDLWGGYANAEKCVPWQRDTIVNAYSVGKGILSVLVLALAQRGKLDLDLVVADVWPEFAARGKQDVRLPVLLSHGAGLPAVRTRLPEGAMLDWDLMCRALADQAPYWQPGTAFGYHSATFGYLVGEVIRRATGERVEDLLRQYVTGPLEADYAWGISADDERRVARTYSPDAEVTLTRPEQWAMAFPPSGDREHDEMIWHTYFNPSGLSGGGVVNTPAWRKAVVPSVNGHGNARAVASIYDALLARGGNEPRLASRRLIERARSVLAEGTDVVLKRPSRFGMGFQLTHEKRRLGHGPRTFGHYGYGGSLGFADPEADVAFGYVRNCPGDRWQTPRTRALVDALYASLADATTGISAG